MSAKFPRRSFAAPLVVTLAVPACLVTSGKQAPPPSGGSTTGGDVRDHRTQEQPHANPPGPHVNPPRPTDTSAQPTDPPTGTQPGNDTMQQQSPPTQQAPLRTWTVMLQGKDCVAQYDVTCPPKSTCNPPPPTRLARCPDGITVERPYKIREESTNTCALYYPMPDCPAGVACNPPRPQKVDCPTR